MEHKTVGVSGLKVLEDEGEGIVSAFVSVTGLKDNVKDIIEPGAYEKTLATRMPKGVWSHDWDKPISKTLDIKEILPGSDELPKTLPNGDSWPADAGALFVKMQFNMGTQRGRDAYSDVTFFGDQQEWSIGYNVPAGGAKMDSKAQARRINTLDLYEFSPVLFGAMPAARTSSVKEAQLAYKSLQGIDLDDWLSEVEEMKTLAGPGKLETKALPGETDDDDQLEFDFTELQEKGLLSAENVTLLKKAIGVLTEVLDAAIPSEKKSEVKTAFTGIEVKEFMDIVDAVDAADVLDEKSIEEFMDMGELFDAAVKSEDTEGIESYAESLLDLIDDQMESAGQDATDGLKAMANAIASIMTKMMDEEEEEEDPENEAVDPAEKEKEEKAGQPIQLDSTDLASVMDIKGLEDFLSSH